MDTHFSILKKKKEFIFTVMFSVSIWNLCHLLRKNEKQEMEKEKNDLGYH